MATQVERLITQLEVNQRQFEKKLNAANQNARRKTRSIQRKFDKMNRNVSRGVQRHFGTAARAIAAIDGPLGGIAGRLTSIGGIASGTTAALGGLSLAFAGAGFTAFKALQAFQKFETQQLVTEQVIRATGGAAGKTAEDLEALAQSIGFGTLASVQEVRAASAQLLTFRSISGETFDRTLRLSQDLATLGFGTLKTSAVQLGKALEDPATGMTALRRVGVSFSEAQKQVIMDLFETGRVAEAQEKILDALEQQVGGSGAASGQGLAGAYDSLSEATGILLERWGSQIAEAVNLRGALLGIAGAIDTVNQRASVGGQLIEVNRDLTRARERVRGAETEVTGIPGMDNPFTQGRALAPDRIAAETELNELLERRHQLQMQIFRSAEESSQASLQGVEAQKALEQERAEGVQANLQKELELAKLNSTEREIHIQLAKAGVSAESELGQQIVQSIKDIEAARKAHSDAKSADKASEKAAVATERETRAVLDLIAAKEFELALIGETARNQEIMIALRHAGAAATDAQRQKIIELTGAVHDAEEGFGDMGGVGRSVLSGLASDLRNGVSAGEAFANVLDKIIDRLLNSAFDILFGGPGKGGGLFGSIFGFADGGVATPVGPRPLRRYANGGVAARPSIFGEAGPEAAVPLPDGRRIPVDLNLGDMRRRARQAIDIVLQTDTGLIADIANKQITTREGDIINVSVDRSRQAAREELPDNIQDAQRRGELP
ncbi:MAG: hypothetical protein GY788_23540 [bacterium]|nr:hypothetical protein [bacterium]